MTTTLSTTIVRNIMKESLYATNSNQKMTVIKRDGEIVVRLDQGGSCRNAESTSERLALAVSKLTGCKAVGNPYHGRKGFYSYTWLEATLTQG